MSPRIILSSASIYAFLAIAIGAFGAHALKDLLTPYQHSILQTAIDYQFWHALALLFLGLYADTYTLPRVVPLAMIIGTAIFSGTLYAIILTGHGFFGAITPIGGLLLLGSWAGFLGHLLRKQRHN